MPLERLQKVMARAGVASRRACEELIIAGRVEVNGAVVTELGTKVDAQRDRITVDGAPLEFNAHPARSYLMLYKPAGYLSVFNDERGRPGLEKLVPSEQRLERLFTVGRLDLDSEGLLLLTNDGELAQVLSHPSHQHAKVYLALVDHRPGTDDLARLQRGVIVDGEKTAPSTWRVMEEAPKVQPATEGTLTQGVWLKVVLREGRKRQIRRMAALAGLEVRRLIRIQLGPLVLDRKLRPGGSRRLTQDEIRRLHQSVRNAEEREMRGARFAAMRGNVAPRRSVTPIRRRSGAPQRSPGARPRPEQASRGAAASPAHPRAALHAPASQPVSAARSWPIERASRPTSPARQRGDEAPRPRPEAPATRRPGATAPAQPRSSAAPRSPAARQPSETHPVDRRRGAPGSAQPRRPAPRSAGRPPAPGGSERQRSGGARRDNSSRPASSRPQSRRSRPAVGPRPAGPPNRKR